MVDLTVVFYQSLPHSAIGPATQYYAFASVPIEPVLIPIQALVVSLCVYEKVSDSVESGVWFAGKNLTPRRMH